MFNYLMLFIKIQYHSRSIKNYLTLKKIDTSLFYTIKNISVSRKTIRTTKNMLKQNQLLIVLILILA